MAPPLAQPPSNRWLLWPTILVWPITQEWLEADANGKGGHNGTDFGVPYGTPLRAPAASYLAAFSRDDASGLYVILSHPGGLSTGYAHLSELGEGLAVGMEFQTGYEFAASGNSGKVRPPDNPATTQHEGAHLHFTLRVLYQGRLRTVNPASRLNPADVKIARGE